MKYFKFAPIVLALVFLLFYYFGIYEGEKPSPQTDQQTQGNTKVDEQPPVTIGVTPVNLGQDAKVWRFAVVFDTHSENLDQDPTKIAVLVDDENNAYLPTAWEGPGPGGHHREGFLIFDSITPTPAYVELKIKDVGGVPERSFRWNLE
ncbi:MAG: hypothetical protein WC873_04650 [Candidatus Gracilibacteria bacterium]